jgi:phosphate transport system ATP-binding protein
MTEQSKISIKNLNFYYAKRQVIKNLSLEVKANEILSVFGPANSGTTTLLRTLNRMWDFIPGARMEGEVLPGREQCVCSKRQCN